MPVITFLRSSPPSIHLHSQTQEYPQISQTSVKHGTILLSALFIPGKSLWVLIALLGGVRGHREHPNPKIANQKRTFNLAKKGNNSLTVWSLSIYCLFYFFYFFFISIQFLAALFFFFERAVHSNKCVCLN